MTSFRQSENVIVLKG